MEQIQKNASEKFDAILEALNKLNERIAVLERWTWTTIGACAVATFLGPFIVKAIFPKL